MTDSEKLENQKKEIEALKKKVDELEKSTQLEALENESLKKKLNEAFKSSEDLAAYKVFSKANEMFLKWILVLFTATGVFGFLTLSNIFTYIKEESVKEVSTKLSNNLNDPKSDDGQAVRKKIIEGFTQGKYIEKVTADITNKVQEDVVKISSARANSLLADFNNDLKAVQTKFEKDLDVINKQYQRDQKALFVLQTELDNVKPKTQLTQEKMYYVVAGAEADKQSLKNEFLAKSKNSLGNKYDIRICSPKNKNGNKFFAVVLSLKGKQASVSLSEANTLVNMAKKDGFRSDTYAIRESSAFFDGTKCELL